jgi:leucyl/phenylalanyl-tRNA--protein transferase
MSATLPVEGYAAPPSDAIASPQPASAGATDDAAPRFVERPSAIARRYLLGAGYALRPVRIGLMPTVAWMTAEYLVNPRAARRRLENPVYHGWQGLIGISKDLSPGAILDGYRRGIFPLCHIGPMKWWSPNVRPVMHPHEGHIEKSVRRLLRQKRYRVTFDTDFAAVMRACAEPRPGKTPLTWITPRVMRAFWELHQAGHAHSDGRLVGGDYGLACGNVYFGESKFSLERDASKIADAILNMHLAHWGFVLREGKWMTGHLARLGHRSISRDEFLPLLREHAWKPGRVGRWTVDETLDVSQWRTKG